MRILGARRHLLLLVAPVLIFGTAVEEVASGRITEWATEIFAPEHRASGPRPTKREVAKLAKPDALQSTAPDSSANASPVTTDAPQGSAAPTVPPDANADGALPNATSQPTARHENAPSQGSPAQQVSAQGFSTTGVNPLVLMLLGALGDANGLVTDSSSAVAVESVTGFAAGATELAGNLAEDSNAAVYGTSDDSLSVVKSSAAGFGDGVISLGRLGGGGSDAAALPAAVVVAVATPDAREELRTFVSAYYGSVPDTSLAATAAELESTGDAAAIVNPEPGTLVLFGSGLIGLTHWARRRNRRNSPRATR